MKVKALKTFSGAVSMNEGETRDINTKDILEDLLKNGYVKEEKREREVKKNESKRDNNS